MAPLCGLTVSLRFTLTGGIQLVREKCFLQYIMKIIHSIVGTNSTGAFTCGVGVVGATNSVNLTESIYFYNLLNVSTSKCQTICLQEHVSVMSVCVFVCRISIYSGHALSLSSFPSLVSLAVGDSCSAAQLDDHLLAVVEGSLVSQLLQGPGCVCQHAHPLAGSRQKGGRKVAASQHHGLRLLPLAGPRLALLCTQQHTHTKLCYCGISGKLFYVISHQQPIRLQMLLV